MDRENKKPFGKSYDVPPRFQSGREGGDERGDRYGRDERSEDPWAEGRRETRWGEDRRENAWGEEERRQNGGRWESREVNALLEHCDMCLPLSPSWAFDVVILSIDLFTNIIACYFYVSL